MTAIALPRRNPLPGLVLVMMAAFVLLAATLSLHALQAHQDKASRVQQCMNQNGPVSTWKRPNGYKASICQISSDTFGVEVTDGDGNPITSFIKEKLSRLEQVERYLTNRGYTKIAP